MKITDCFNCEGNGVVKLNKEGTKTEICCICDGKGKLDLLASVVLWIFDRWDDLKNWLWIIGLKLRRL